MKALPGFNVLLFVGALVIAFFPGLDTDMSRFDWGMVMAIWSALNVFLLKRGRPRWLGALLIPANALVALAGGAGGAFILLAGDPIGHVSGVEVLLTTAVPLIVAGIAVLNDVNIYRICRVTPAAP